MSKLAAVHAEIRRLDALRAADQLAVKAALDAAEKAVAAALAASEKAVNKAELGQQRTNEGQNEFRGQLRDQAATLMPRAEVESLVRELRALIDASSTERVRLVNENQNALAEIRQRLARTASGDAVTSQAWKYLIAAGTLLIGGVGVVLTIITGAKP